MESNHHEDSKSSSEETDRSNDDSMGTGRSYECVFCKRGFTTAQALGGHMNIHRKDRAKSRQGSVASISSKVVINDDQEEYGSLIRGYPQIIQSYPPPHHQYYPTNNHHAVHINNYQSFFPSPPPPITTTTTTWRPGSFGPTVHGEDFYVQSSHQLVMDDWRSCLSLQIGASRGDRGSKEMREDGNGLQEDELDLELRLGHDP